MTVGSTLHKIPVCALDRFVRSVTKGEIHLLDAESDEIPEVVVEEVRALLSSLQLSSDSVLGAVAAREVKRVRALPHDDRSGTITALRVLYALDRCLAGLPAEAAGTASRKDNPRDRD